LTIQPINRKSKIRKSKIKELISIIIPLYNKEQYIRKTLESVFSQTFQQFEIVIVDDGSTDGSLDVVRQIDDPRIRIVCKENGGVSSARNMGIGEARYPYLAFLDADDLWMPDHLEVIARLIQKYPQCVLFGTSYYFQRPGQQPTLPMLRCPLPFDGYDGVLSNYYDVASGIDMPMQTSTFVVSKAVAQQIGGFFLGVQGGEDLLFMAQVYALGDIAYSRRPTSTYLLFYEGKSDRSFEKTEPLTPSFDALLRTAAHRPGVRRYVASWHKRRVTTALYGHHYRAALREFLRALRLAPLDRKLYTSTLMTLVSLSTGIDLYTLNQKIRK